jgi:hypothetical protein
MRKLFDIFTILRNAKNFSIFFTILRNAQKWFDIFRNFAKCSKFFDSFRNFAKCSKLFDIFLNFAKCSKLSEALFFAIVGNFSQILRSAQNCSIFFAIWRNVQKISQFCEVLKSLRYFLPPPSQVIKNTLEPSWAEKEMSLVALLANGDRQRSLRFTVWDWNASGKPDLIGAFETSVERLEAGQLTHQVSNFS